MNRATTNCFWQLSRNVLSSQTLCLQTAIGGQAACYSLLAASSQLVSLSPTQVPPQEETERWYSVPTATVRRCCGPRSVGPTCGEYCACSGPCAAMTAASASTTAGTTSRPALTSTRKGPRCRPTCCGQRQQRALCRGRDLWRVSSAARCSAACTRRTTVPHSPPSWPSPSGPSCGSRSNDTKRTAQDPRRDALRVEALSCRDRCYIQKG
jgi:hypothetical protein